MRQCPACDSLLTQPGWDCLECGHSPQVDRGVPILAPDAAGRRVSFDPSAFKRLAELEAGHFWFEARNRLIVWALARYFPYAKSFFELGCGTGYVLSCIAKAFPTMKLSAGELHLDGLVVARSRIPRKSELLQLDARRLPFKEEYDVIGAFDVLEHIEEDELVLTQICAALKLGGGLLLTVPQHRFLWSAADEYALHVRRYSEAELRQKVIGAGFSILRSTSFVSLLLPAMLVSSRNYS